MSLLIIENYYGEFIIDPDDSPITTVSNGLSTIYSLIGKPFNSYTNLTELRNATVLSHRSFVLQSPLTIDDLVADIESSIDSGRATIVISKSGTLTPDTHLFVVYGYTKGSTNRIHYADPWTGKLRNMTYTEFKNLVDTNSSYVDVLKLK